MKAAGVAFDELGPEETTPPADETPAPAPAQEPALPGVGGQASPATPPTTPETPKPESSAEVRLMEREAAILEREQSLKAADADLKSLRDRLDTYESAAQRFVIDPVEFIRQLAPDVDLDDVAKLCWYAKLGNAAPPEFRIQKDARGAHLEVQKLRSELEAEKKRQSEEAARKSAEMAEAQFVDSLRGFVQAVPDKYRLVQSLSKQKPDVAVRMMHDAARMLHAQQGKPIGQDEAAVAVEKYLDEIGYVPAAAPVASAQPPVSAQQQPPTTIRNSHSAVQPTRTPPDESDPKLLRKRAFEAAFAAAGITGEVAPQYLE